MERGRRIELLALAWKAKVLPLYEPRINISMNDDSPLRYLLLYKNNNKEPYQPTSSWTTCKTFKIDPTLAASNPKFVVDRLIHPLVEVDGFEPTHSERTDLQSAAIHQLRSTSI